MAMACLEGQVGPCGPAGIVPVDGIGIDHTLWGYVVRAEEPHAGAAWFVRRLAVLAAAAATVSVMFLWLIPGDVPSSGRIAATGLLAGFAGIAAWRARGGCLSETHVDLQRAEVRAVLRDADGRTRLTGRLSFRDIREVHIDRSGQPEGRARLVLTRRDAARSLTVATGTEDALVPLCHRIGRHLRTGHA
jgi:hypothetical protein